MDIGIGKLREKLLEKLECHQHWMVSKTHWIFIRHDWDITLAGAGSWAPCPCNCSPILLVPGVSPLSQLWMGSLLSHSGWRFKMSMFKLTQKYSQKWNLFPHVLTHFCNDTSLKKSCLESSVKRDHRHNEMCPEERKTPPIFQLHVKSQAVAKVQIEFPGKFQRCHKSTLDHATQRHGETALQRDGQGGGTRGDSSTSGRKAFAEALEQPCDTSGRAHVLHNPPTCKGTLSTPSPRAKWAHEITRARNTESLWCGGRKK